jgi:cathepsin D
MKLIFIKFVSLFVIFSAFVIHDINAKPLHTIKLTRRDPTSGSMDPMDYAKHLKNAALNKYKYSKEVMEKDSSKTFNNNASFLNSNNKANSKKQSTIILKDIQFDTAYFGTITIGNQNFNILMDTGSSNLFVPNTNCTTAACQNHNSFDLKKSKTFKKEGNPWNITFGTGSASGVTGIDNVKIGDFTAENLVFGLADNLSDDFVGLESDGILGLAFDRLNTMDNHAPTLITTLIKQNKINPLFSFHLSRVSDFNDQGTLTLGGVDNNKFKGKITFNRVINTPTINALAFWLINVDDASVNKKSLSFKGRNAIIDTGTSTIILPDNDAAEIHSQISGATLDPNSGMFIIPCNTTSVVAFKFGGVDFEINPKDLITAPIDGSNCISSIMPGFNLDGKNDTWLVGTPFLKNVYSVFQVKNPSVGFARNK